MDDFGTSAAWRYHNATKHSPESVQASRHVLDSSIQPRPYKLYEDLKALPLTGDLPWSTPPAISSISGLNDLDGRSDIPELEALASILHFSAGITKWLRTPVGRVPFRAASCTGALYHIELYVVSGAIPELEAGVYHYGVPDEALRQIRKGDFRDFVAEATGRELSVEEAPLTVVCTSTYWRNSWKYQARAYRHCFWDCGTILANMLAMASAHGLHARVIAGFSDIDINRLLDLDDQSEVTISLVSIGRAPSRSPDPSPPVARLGLATAPLSERAIDYPAIREIHTASSLDGPDVSKWRGPHPPVPIPTPTGEVVRLRPIEPASAPSDPIERVIERRGSSRRFGQDSISFEALSSVISSACRGISSDYLAEPGAALNDIYLIVNAVDGLQNGTYVFHRNGQLLERLTAGDLREVAGYLDLGQRLGADAAVNVYFLTDPGPLFERFGDRGYRAAQLDASITAGKMYLAAYALGLGATGLTFFDDEVTKFFSPHARGKSVMFLIALGVPVKTQSM